MRRIEIISAALLFISMSIFQSASATNFSDVSITPETTSNGLIHRVCYDGCCGTHRVYHRYAHYRNYYDYGGYRRYYGYHGSHPYYGHYPRYYGYRRYGW